MIRSLLIVALFAALTSPVVAQTMSPAGVPPTDNKAPPKSDPPKAADKPVDVPPPANGGVRPPAAPFSTMPDRPKTNPTEADNTCLSMLPQLMGEAEKGNPS